MPSLPSGTGRTHRYRAEVHWTGSTGSGPDGYDRDHTAVTDPPTIGLDLSADPAFGGDPRRLDPEQLVLTAVSSCHLLSFLAAAARARVEVVAYRDRAEAELHTATRPVRIARIVLRPRITVAGGAGDEARLRDRTTHLVSVAQRTCHVANSLRSEIVVEPTIVVIDDTCSRSGF